MTNREKHYSLDIISSATTVLERINKMRGYEYLVMGDDSHQLTCALLTNLKTISNTNKRELKL